jgi:hypothetical protein
MSKNLTEESLRAIALAREAARSLNHTCLGTEHVLVGIYRVRSEKTRRVFEKIGFEKEALREAFLAVASPASAPPKNRYLPLSARLVSSLEAAARAARDLGRRIAPEHILFGLLVDETSTACQVLARMYFDPGRVVGEILAVIGETRPKSELRLKLAPEIVQSITHLQLATLDLKTLIEHEMETSPTRKGAEPAVEPAREYAPLPPAHPVATPELPLFICPRSHGPMEKLKGPDGLEIGLCPECLGTFVPAGQIMKLVARAAEGTLDTLFDHPQE